MDERAILSAIEEYNKYHGREAIAELEGISGDRLIVRFRGPFCESCGLREWFEDLAIELKRRGIEASTERAIEAGDGSFLVSFAIESRAAEGVPSPSPASLKPHSPPQGASSEPPG